MSRIHEALKKAELEAGTVTGVPDLALERETTGPLKPEHNKPLAQAKSQINLPPLAEFSGTAASPSLRFEEISTGCAQVSWRPDPLMDVFASTNVSFQAAEQFRTLRSRLYHLRSENPLRVVLITSPLPSDGKTFVASNLAQSIVRQQDQRVLLIDADLRASHLHIFLDAPTGPGLGEYLSGTADEMAVIQHGQKGSLYFIGGGKHASNASELLSNGRLKHLIARTVSSFDWIIIDSPPWLPVADASMIAGLCDGVLLVVRAGATSSSAAHKACQELKKRNLIGIVLNAVDEETLSYGSYYAGGYGSPVGDNSNQKISLQPERVDVKRSD